MVQECSSEAILDALVTFPTVSSASNLPLIEFVTSYLAHWNVEAEIVACEDGTKANLFATIGPQVAGGVVLSGHTDVVPADGQTWSTAPFRVTQRDGRLYGRGTCDMKGFLAVSLAMVPEMLSAGMKRPIHLAFSYDEEVGCLGAPAMIERMRRTIPAPSAVIVGEPTEMAVVTGHKGVLKMTTRVTGKPVHSSVVDKGVSATAYAARLAVWLDDRMRRNKDGASYDMRFDPPYTTLHTGIISGGSAFNITARDCVVISDIRTLPHESSANYLAEFTAYADSLAEEMRRVDPQSGIEIEVECDVPGCRKEAAGAAEALARLLTGDNGDHVVAFGTEAGQFQDANYSVVVCGPGNIAQGHTPDEFIEISEIRSSEAFQRRLIQHLAS